MTTLASPGLAPPKTSNATNGPPPGVSQASTVATAKTAHSMLIAVALELVFVVVMTMLAGISESWSTGILTLMIALLVLRGLFEVNIFGNWINANPLTPSNPVNVP